MRTIVLICLGIALANAAGPIHLGKRAIGRRAAQAHKKISKMIDDVTENKMDDSRSDGRGHRMKRIEEVDDDEKGDKITKIQHTFRGVEVFGGEITHKKVRGGLRDFYDKGSGNVVEKRHVEPSQSKTGKVHFDLDKDLGKFNAKDLKHKQGDVMRKVEGAIEARRKKRDTKMNVKNRKAKPVIIPAGKMCDKDRKKAEVGYVVSFDVEGGNEGGEGEDEDDAPSRPVTVTNAAGEIICEWNNLMSNRREKLGTGPGGNEKVGKYQYSGGNRKGEYEKMTVTVMDNGRCQMVSDTVKTIDLQGSSSNSKTTAYEFDCYHHDKDAINGAFSPLNDAHYFGNKIYGLYVDWYGKSPLKKTPLTMKVHYKKRFENAFWNGQAMTFGDGADYFHPLVSLDVSAHEVSHGVTEQTSGLRYQGQSGGLNEAFSDMAGKAAERYVRGKNGVDWGLGGDIVKGKGKKLRCMDHPECDGSSIGHVSKYYSGMDVHHSSGVFNKVFYLVAKKFKYDVWDAFDLFYTANTKGYWSSNTDFDEAATETMKAAEDMKAGRHNNFIYDHLNIQDIVSAFKEVGINCRQSRGSWDCTS